VPVYEYVCTECGENLEARQSFTDPALTECPMCSGRLRKVLSPVGVVFKGSGFYRNDSRAASAATSANGADGGIDGAGKADKTSSGDGAGERTAGADKPAAATEKKPAPAASGTSSGSSGSGQASSSSGKPSTAA
jgi:putative FmdB family regulatory protein